MQLLVSVRDAAEACVALESGADIIDAKDPAQGPLGAVSVNELRAIVAAVAGRRPVSAAIGELGDRGAPHSPHGRVVAESGVAFAKVGFDHGDRGLTSAAQLGRLVDTLREHAPPAGSCGLVLAAYADAPRGSIDPHAIVELASQCGAVGVLLDTCRKDGEAKGLFDAMCVDDVAMWVAVAQMAGLLVALAGSLTIDDLARAHTTGADLVGVRGAACDRGRDGRVSAVRVRELTRAVAACHPPGANAIATQTASALAGRQYLGPWAMPSRRGLFPAAVVNDRSTSGDRRA